VVFQGIYNFRDVTGLGVPAVSKDSSALNHEGSSSGR
jgi:hypothetical protein